MSGVGYMWVVTDLEHPAVPDFRGHCPECVELIPAAIATARVRGSRGATQRVIVEPGSIRGHSATVARALFVYTSQGEPLS